MDVTSEKTKEAQSPTVAVPLLFGLAVVAVASVLALSGNRVQVLHSVLETFSIVVGISAFVVTWKARRVLADNYLVLLGIACFFAALIDILHTLSAAEMAVFSAGDPGLSTQFRISARLCESLSFLVAVSLPRHRFKPVGLLAGYGAVTALLVWSILGWKIFPACFDPLAGPTPFVIGAKYLVILVSFATLAVLLRLRGQFDRRVWRCLVAACLFQALAETLLAGYRDLDDLHSVAGHLVKTAAFLCLLMAIVEAALVRPLAQMERALTRERGLSAEVERQGRALVSVMRDMTDREETERRLRLAIAETEKARRRAEQADQAKSRFLVAASHDLRQPLQAARLFLEALSFRLKADEDRALLERAMLALAGGDELLQSLQDLSTLQSDGAQAEIQPVALPALLGRLVDESAPLAAARGLRLRMVPSAARVSSDPQMLGRMLRNLLSNAIRYTERGKVLLGCRRRGRELWLCVYDTGCGIAEDERELIFEEFYQAGRKTRHCGEGQGLGLAIVRRQAQLLGHRIELRSHPGRGSMFAVVVTGAEHPGRRPPPGSLPGRKGSGG